MAVAAIVRRDLLRFVRSPLRTVLMFAIPLVMAAIFSLVFGGDGADAISIRVLVWDEDGSLLSALLQGGADDPRVDQRLDLVPVGAEGYQMMEEGEASALVHIPAGFTEAFLKGQPATLEVVKNPAQRFLPQVVEEGVSVGAVALSQLSRVFRPELEQIHSMLSGDGLPGDLAIGAMAVAVNQKLRRLERSLFPPAVKLETVTLKPAGDAVAADVGILSYFLPGLAIMGILFLAQAATRDVLLERESGLLRHLLTAPVTVGQYLVGKCLSVFLATAAGFAILVLLGLVAGVTWGPPLAAAALVLASSLAAAGTLLLIMSLVGSQRQGDALTTIVIIVWSLLGGAFIPISQIPRFLHPICRATLTYWATDGFTTLILGGGGLTDIVPNLVVLTACGALFLLLGALFLRRRILAGGT